jgi:hypothetical protein
MKDRQKNDTAPAATRPAYVHTLVCRYFGLIMEEENVICCADFFPVASIQVKEDRVDLNPPRPNKSKIKTEGKTNLDT